VAVAIVIAIAIVVVVLVAAGIVLARRGAGKAQERVDAHLAGLTVQRRSKANLFGMASAEATKVRGLGVLALTPDDLVFVQFVPDREVRVPRSSITSVTTSTSFLGTTQAKDLLVVAWSGSDGTDGDEAAWDVPDLPDWRAALQPDAS
jgi:hypothetical protein